ncbi:unnamed protein product [Notodromas monacha]|uniref:rRNA adenine N(6)-methyltransferase n=1 Tax=Notodromas monacha TaxID=399045 RepID=A0A7R9BL05_9CRUS|nr:unnamed protein product [Notodromas monacha]CAG0916330.1 unnamed protein product [Notodromas monacha]
MSDPTRLQAVDVERDSAKLTQTHLDFMRRLEKENVNRVLKLRAIRRKNILTGALLGVRAQKKLSQNFLLDPAIINRFVSKARVAGCHVVEVGPGPGSLTRAILQLQPRSLTVIEKDERFLPLLESLADTCVNEDGRMRIVHDDILTFDMGSLGIPTEVRRDWNNRELPDISLIGNLPFSIATRLVINWLFDIATRRGPWEYGRVPMVLSFQEEVAQRIVAEPGTENRSRLSVMCQAFCDVRYGMTIRGGSFVPAPDVDAGIVVFTPRATPLVPVEEFGFPFFERVVRDIFNCKKKDFRKGVKNLIPEKLHEILLPEIVARAGIEVDLECSGPIYLTVSDFGRIASAIKELHVAIPELAKYDFRSARTTRTNGEELLPRVERFLRDGWNAGGPLSAFAV